MFGDLLMIGLVIFIWFVMGAAVWGTILGIKENLEPLGWCNFFYLYTECGYTVFGCLIISIVCSLISPPFTLFYWVTRPRRKRW